eukprot:6868137-Ditylum_brightwellii.AAC.1
MMAHAPRKKAPSPMQQTCQASIMLTLPSNTPVNFTSPTTNERGELLTWNSNSEDGIHFKDLYLAGHFKDLSASHVKVKYNSHVGKYASAALNSALQNLCGKDQRESDTRQTHRSH